MGSAKFFATENFPLYGNPFLSFLLIILTYRLDSKKWTICVSQGSSKCGFVNVVKYLDDICLFSSNIELKGG